MADFGIVPVGTRCDISKTENRPLERESYGGPFQFPATSRFFVTLAGAAIRIDTPLPYDPMESSKRGLPLPPALLGFLFLLVAMTALSYGVGRMAGPVAPGMHRTVPAEQDGEPGMSDMHGLGPVGAGAVVRR